MENRSFLQELFFYFELFTIKCLLIDTFRLKAKQTKTATTKKKKGQQNPTFSQLKEA